MKFLNLHDFIVKHYFTKNGIKEGRYVTLTGLKKMMTIEIDIEEDLKERCRKCMEDESDQSEQNFEQFTEKLDLVKEDIKTMKIEFSNKLDLVMEHLIALKNQQN